MVPTPGAAWGTTDPITYTGFLEPEVDRVRSTLDGNAAALEERFQTAPGGTTIERDDFADLERYARYREQYEEVRGSDE